jgi:hypothetical protein
MTQNIHTSPTLSDLSPEEMDEFVSPAPSSPAPMRHYPPPASDEIKLSVEEVKQALKNMPRKRSPEKAKEERIRRLGLALLAKREMALVDSFVRVALGPEPTNEQREAMQAALGHMYRVGGMSMLTHQAKPTYAAAAVADVLESRWDNDKQKQRLEIIDAALRARDGKPMKLVADKVNKELERRGLKPERPVSEGHLHKRWRTLRQTDEPKTDSPSD